ncbi:phosphatidate cytidylyltransferase [Marinicauda algicola]|uniref:Phosphatidate cytidylyltransferase n=1 Tax=Marinicauda algicola TaxID=2029849 RepID=A0A4S2GWC1_9PROT|nr:phosphatidate cytidylyltransferase [Marinicauda algicola]TGY87410.1 phosphatidate cytidylyltransferase [Marinicauda algicola]
MVPREKGAARSVRDPVFAKRVLSALILAPVALGFVFLGGHGFAIFIAAFAAAMAWEWVRMSDREAPPRAFATATGTAVGAALLAAQSAFGWTLVWIAGGAIGAWLDRRPRGRGYEAGLGVAYVASSAAALVALRNETHGGLDTVLYLLAVVWSADTFAYLVGTWVGGPKLLPAASPNKTWSGLTAGIGFGVGVGALVGSLVGFETNASALVALPLALAAVLGDLLMSLAKRRFGVKDAGSVIPGHGGVLDRVDALMLATLIAGGLMFIVPQILSGSAM